MGWGMSGELALAKGGGSGTALAWSDVQVVELTGRTDLA